jgi:hypothetical protein
MRLNKGTALENLEFNADSYAEKNLLYIKAYNEAHRFNNAEVVK